MAISFSDIEDAFFFVSMDPQFMHSAFLCKETGEIFYQSEMDDSDEFFEEMDDPDKYIPIPHKNELDLGRELVFEFTSTYLPEAFDRVYSIFRRKGAYAKYKALLESKGALQDWYDFENNRQTAALKKWCRENDIEIKE